MTPRQHLRDHLPPGPRGRRIRRTLSVAVPLALPLVLLAGCGDDAATPRSGPRAERSVDPARRAALEVAESAYRDFVQQESAALLARTGEFVAAVEAGRDDDARALYPRARTHWERIETVAESFGDLDPRMDAREADLEPGEDWTGWHVLEKDLWPARATAHMPLSQERRGSLARGLLTDTEELDRRIRATGEAALRFPVDEIADGARGLLEEVATGKVTGEEEYWSRTDLWDFQANVDGARRALEVVAPILASADPDLAALLVRRLAALQALLDTHRRGDGFVGYDELGGDEVDALAAAVDGLAEPLGRLSAAVA